MKITGSLICSFVAIFGTVFTLHFGYVAPATAQTDDEIKPFQGMEYRCIGPFRGGRVTAVTGIQDQPNVFFFGAAGGGLWKTANAGATWTNISDGHFKTGSVGAVAVAPSDSNVIYVGMGEGPIRGVTTSHGDGVYKSTDAGKTWSQIGLTAARQIPSIRVHPETPDVVFVAAQGSPWGPNSERGVFRSRDGGANWVHVLKVDQYTGACDLVMDQSNPRILYAAMWDHQRTPWQVRSGGPGGGIYKTTDGGDTWAKLEKGLPDEVGKVGITVSPAQPDRLWAIIESDEGGLYRSDDAGDSWKLINDKRVLRARSWYYMHVFADPSDNETVFVLNAPMLKSNDGGKTFAQIKTPHGDNHDLWINPRDHQIMINGNDGGANVSLDGGKTWSTQMNQPTAQFYRVITDNKFPYSLYAGQQDNSTVRIASESFDNGIGSGDWESVGGGESAHVAFDPNNPTLVYATSIVGWITEYDRRTRTSRQIQAYPQIGLGTDPAGYKYRFNWNPPVHVSLHDARVIYHAANVLLRSTDRGFSWTPISQDLTRDDPNRQPKGGVPFTNEAAGAEIYNTIFYVAESTNTSGTLWVGSDCGLVHFTDDGGANWRDVTPPELGEAQINCIEISPHDDSTVYVVATKYKLNDFSPLIYRTRDRGKTWQLIVDDLPRSSFVRVVREDPVRENLLFAGTETGVFFSLGGGPWQTLQLDLPVVPVTDLRIQSDDLVVATQGRAFWILDDLSPIRQWTDEIANSEVHLYQPATALRLRPAEGFTQKPGKNPSRGALINIELKNEPDPETTTVRLEILDSEARVVRMFSNQHLPEHECYASTKESHSEPGKPYGLLKLKQGTNRIVWDLRHNNIPCVNDHLIPMGWQGPRVPPGNYQVRLTVDEQVLQKPLTVAGDPRFPDVRFQGYSSVVQSMYELLGEVHHSVNAMRQSKEQVVNRAALAKQFVDQSEIEQRAIELVQSIDAWQEPIIQSKRETQQDLVNYPPGLSIELVYLLSQADGSGPPITEGTSLRFADLNDQWQIAKHRMSEIMDEEVTALNELLQQNGIPQILTGLEPDKK